jgi:putative ATP-dependent endonuclease of OLD family
MRISRIQITNFRNFESLDLAIGEHAVILGENKVGKTNLLFALRLILDPSLADTQRKLRLEDFWDGVERPLGQDDSIKISVEFVDFEKNDNLLAVLADHLISHDPMTAKITYVFRPISGLKDTPRCESDYEFLVYGGNRPDNLTGYELRKWMPMDLFPALRDAESDLARWTRSPLRPILDRAAKTIDPTKLAEIASDVHDATQKIAELPELEEAVERVNNQLISMIGKNQAIETNLGFAPSEPERLLRSLQLMIDGGKRGVAEASLGSANVLYLSLKHLEHTHLVQEGDRQHTFLAIEEPEAHLHPHVQRMIYKTYLRTRDSSEKKSDPRTILLTTHSPNIVAVTPLNDVVVLRKVGGGTRGYSLANLKFSEDEIEDLQRYIDVSRGEIFFAKGVVLVEGDSEKFLLQSLIKSYKPDIDFDSLGISVCSIGGTNFAPYVKLLSKKGLNIPFVVLTDFDPYDAANSQEDSDSEGDYGTHRVVNTIMPLILSKKEWDEAEFDAILDMAPQAGVFLNGYTFEIDLFKANAAFEFLEAIKGVTDNKKMHQRFEEWRKSPSSLDVERFLKDIESVGKGRFAQRLAAVIDNGFSEVCPQYIKNAVNYLVEKISE